MSVMTVEQRVICLVADALGVSEEAVTVTSNLEDLGAEGLDRLSLARSLEKEFDVQIMEAQIVGSETVQDVVDLIPSTREL